MKRHPSKSGERDHVECTEGEVDGDPKISRGRPFLNFAQLSLHVNRRKDLKYSVRLIPYATVVMTAP